MKGSCATRCIPNARARCATSCPMRPSPTMPSVLPRSSLPRKRRFSQRPSFIARSAAGTERASASINAQACSATLMLFAPGALTTRMPRALAAATSTLSTPAPARAITFSCGAAASSAASTFVALRTRSASASARSTASSAGDRPVRASIVQASSARSSSRAERGRSSATTIFIASEYNPCVSNAPRARALRRPAVVQTAKSFQMVRNNAVTRHLFHRLFHRNCVNRRTPSWGADLKGSPSS